MSAIHLTGLDTNVLVRAFAPVEHEHKAAARDLLRSLEPQAPGFISQIVLSEFHWVMTRSYGIAVSDCLDLIAMLLKNPAYEFEDGESVEYALDLAYAGADFPDSLTAQTHRLFGASRTLTFDIRAAKKLDWSLLDQSPDP